MAAASAPVVWSAGSRKLSVGTGRVGFGAARRGALGSARLGAVSACASASLQDSMLCALHDVFFIAHANQSHLLIRLRSVRRRLSHPRLQPSRVRAACFGGRPSPTSQRAAAAAGWAPRRGGPGAAFSVVSPSAECTRPCISVALSLRRSVPPLIFKMFGWLPGQPLPPLDVLMVSLLEH